MDHESEIRAIFRSHRERVLGDVENQPLDLRVLSEFVQAHVNALEDAFVYVAGAIEDVRAELERGSGSH